VDDDDLGLRDLEEAAPGEGGEPPGPPHGDIGPLDSAINIEPQCDSNGTLHDRLWTSHAFKLIKILAAESAASTSKLVLSIVPDAPTTNALCSLDSIVNPNPGVDEASDTDEEDRGATERFDFGVEHGGCEVGIVEPVADIPITRPNVAPLYNGETLLLFAVELRSPANQVVPHGALKVVGSESICVHKLNLVELNKTTRTLRVSMENVDMKADTELYIINFATFSVRELKSLRKWTCGKGLHYDFHVELPPEVSKVAMQRVICKLVSTYTGDPYTLFSEYDHSGQDVACLRFLSSVGMAVKLDENPNCTTWTMSGRGEQHLQVTELLSVPAMALRPRPGVPMAEYCALELHVMLESSGWTFQVRPRKRDTRQKRGEPVGTPVAVDYVVGGEKTWWLNHNQKTFLAAYFRALLLAATHQTPVKHFMSPAWYEAIIEGKNPADRKTSRRRRGEFDFNASEHPEGNGRPRRPAVRRPKAERPERVVVAGAYVQSASEAESSSSNNSSSSSNSSSKESAKSRSRSPSCPSDSAGSQGSDLDDAAPPADILERAQPDADLACGWLAGMPLGDADDGGGGRGMLNPNTFFWHGFRLCATKLDGTIMGYEANCFNRSHTAETCCRRTLSFRANGGPETTLQKLKWWCIYGQAASVANRIEHRDLPYPPGVLPSVAELDASDVVVAQQHLADRASASGVDMRPAKRARR
jgi:hypothetical protein